MIVNVVETYCCHSYSMGCDLLCQSVNLEHIAEKEDWVFMEINFICWNTFSVFITLHIPPLLTLPIAHPSPSPSPPLSSWLLWSMLIFSVISWKF